MESTLTTFEYVETYFLATSAVDAQWQYWVSITFAVIVATFVGAERLSLRTRYLIAALYLVATVVLGSRAILYGVTLAGSLEILQQSSVTDIFPPPNLIAGVSRMLMVIGGVSATLWFLFRKTSHSHTGDQG